MQLNDNEIILLSELLIKVLKHDIKEKNQIEEIPPSFIEFKDLIAAMALQKPIGSLQSVNYKLTQYNTIILQLTGKSAKEIKKDSKLIEEMKLYLNKNEKEKLIKQIEVSKNNQDTYINYIVSRLPNI